LVLAIIAFVCEFLEVRKTEQQQEVFVENEICIEKNEDCIIEDLENDSADSKTTTEHQAAIEFTEIGQPIRLVQEDDKESECNRDIITIAAEVHSQDESNIQATN